MDDNTKKRKIEQIAGGAKEEEKKQDKKRKLNDPPPKKYQEDARKYSDIMNVGQQNEDQKKEAESIAGSEESILDEIEIRRESQKIEIISY